MKAFTMPEIEVQRFAIADVITTSGGGNSGGSTGDPGCPNNVCPED